MKYKKLTWLVAGAMSVSMLASCGGGSSGGGSDDDDDSDNLNISLENVRRVLNTNAQIAYATYNDSVTTAEALQDALVAFRRDPSEANLLAAKRAWLVAREPYGQTEVYRFRDSPIDDEDGPEGDINAWPLGEALIDDVVTNTTDFTEDQVGVDSSAAIIADGDVDYEGDENIINSTVEISVDLISKTATESADERDVISGYHAIEFLLWGQDLKTTDNTATDGTDRDDAVKSVDDDENLPTGGQRPIADFQPGFLYDTEPDYEDLSDLYDDTVPSQRRHKYLEVAVEKLIADLESVRDEWAADGDYREDFTTVDSLTEGRERLTEILYGMGTLAQGELAGERMQIAFTENSQEDEHSCFSDNTHRDIWLNAEGILNSYYGDYAGYDSDQDGTDDAGSSVTGYGFDDLLRDSGLTETAEAIEAALDNTEDGYVAIDASARAGEPVDVLIQGPLNNTNLMAQAILALNALSALIADLAENLEINDDVVDDDGTECDTSNPTASCGG
ncbi:MAG: hypothetical protein MI976_11885 [Pseudomonadales bacterium]|nr:hypothetical protein [Pseudomonadales bacterium]